MIVYAVDASKSAAEILQYQAGIILESARNCSRKHNGFGLVVYAARAAPLVDFTSEPETLTLALRDQAVMRGTPEPVKAVKEALEILYTMRKGLPGIGDLVILLWSMPKRPKIPVSYARVMASSVGADLRIVGLQYAPPKWFRASRYEAGVEIIYRRRAREAELAKKIGCGGDL